MSEPTQAVPIIRFGSYTLDVPAGELHKNGSKIRLPEQPFQILLLLLQRPGDVVTRDELRHLLWSSDTFVDFETGLNSAVKKLRDVLGDSAETPRFVETLPRRGFRFICPVNGTQSSAGAQALPPMAWWRQRRAAGVLGIAALLAGLLGANVGGLRDRITGKSSMGPIRSLAVLPCKNLTGDPQQDFLADGLTDALTTHLAQVKALVVPSVTSSLYYKNEHKRLPEIASELHVQGVVEPSVQRSGQRLLINVQLINAATDRHLWAREYVCDPNEIQTVLGRVARDLVSQINVAMAPGETSRVSMPREASPEAYEAFMKGRYHLRKGTGDDRAKAAAYFTKVIEMDPSYAPAYGELAVLYAHGGAYLMGPGVEAGVQARQAANKALELDERLPQAHAALGWIKISDWDWKGAEQEFQRAIEFNPNYATAHTWYSQFLSQMRRFDEAIAQSQVALQLEPADPTTVTHAAIAYWEAGRIDEAMAYWNKVLDLDPNYWGAYAFLGRAYVKKGMYKEAIAALEKTVALRGRDNANLGTLAHAYAKVGRRQDALKLVAEMQALAEKRGGPGAYGLALAYAGLGDRERAFAVLEQAYERRRSGMFFLNSEPLFEDFHSDPRFRDLIIRIGLPPESLPPLGGSPKNGTK